MRTMQSVDVHTQAERLGRALRRRAHDIRGWTRAFVLAAYVLAAAWSFNLLLRGDDNGLLWLLFDAALIGAVVLLVVYRATDRPGFRALLPDGVWGALILMMTVLTFYAWSHNYDGSSHPGILGALGATAPVVVGRLEERWHAWNARRGRIWGG